MSSNLPALIEKTPNPLALCTDSVWIKAVQTYVQCAPEQAPIIMLHCLEQGITPVDYQRTYHTIQGKPCMRSDAMLAEFRRRGGRHRIIERSNNRAAVELLAPGDDKPQTFELTWAEIENSRWPWKDPKDRAKGLKDNWSTATDRKAMLWARLVSDTIRAVMPEINAGIYAPEEMQDAIEGEIVSRTETRLTAEEAMKLATQSTEPAPVITSPEPEVPWEPNDAEEIVDASFDPATFDQQPGFATPAQVEKIAHLFLLGDVSIEDQRAALQRRNASVIRNLKAADASDLILRLEAMVAKKKQPGE